MRPIRSAWILPAITWSVIGMASSVDEAKPPRGYSIPLIDLASQQDRRVARAACGEIA